MELRKVFYPVDYVHDELISRRLGYIRDQLYQKLLSQSNQVTLLEDGIFMNTSAGYLSSNEAVIIDEKIQRILNVKVPVMEPAHFPNNRFP